MTNMKFKKAISLMVATGVVAGCFGTTTAFAIESTQFQGDDSLVIGAKSATRSYELYQIFKGRAEMNDEGNEVLSDVEWGDSVGTKSTEFIAALTADTLPDGTTNPIKSYFANLTTAVQVSEAVTEFNDDSEYIDAFAAIAANFFAKNGGAKVTVDKPTATDTNTGESDYAFSGIAQGYYLVNEVANSSNKDNTITYSKYMVNVIGKYAVSKIETKDNAGPTITKGIETGEADKAETEEDESITNKDDVAIGDVVKFRLDSQVPDMSGYTKYYYIVHDTMSTGLTFNDDVTVKVGSDTLTKVDETTGKTSTGKNFYYTTGKDKDGKTTLKIVLCNFRQYDMNAAITIEYSANANDGLVMGNTELNENVVNLQYSNNPNYDYKGINEPGQTNDDPDNPTYEPTSVTPDSKVNVYSTSVEVVKVNSNGNRLDGAKFQLKGDNLNQVVQVTEDYTPAGYLKDGIKDAYYKALTNAYVTSAPTSDSALYAAKEYVRYTKDGEDSYKTDLNGDYYLNKTTGEYVAVADTQVSADLETDYIAYTKTDSLTIVDVKTKKEDCVGEVGSDGTIRFDGLSAGTYTLSEIEAPTGYSLLDSDITITVKFSKDATNKWTFKQDGGTAVSGTDATTNPDSGKLALHVVNKEGSSLPSTGGIGTTIFYVAGSALVISAGVLLVTKKRMKKADK